MRHTLIVLLLAAGCRVAPPTATANDAARANVELAELSRGRSLLVAKCGNCHRPPMPADHGAHEWPVMLDEMSVRANLDVQQRHLIEQYLVTMAPAR
jgi:cytochrome c553